jgi:hypothetical protein
MDGKVFCSLDPFKFVRSSYARTGDENNIPLHIRFDAIVSLSFSSENFYDS